MTYQMVNLVARRRGKTRNTIRENWGNVFVGCELAAEQAQNIERLDEATTWYDPDYVPGNDDNYQDPEAQDRSS